MTPFEWTIIVLVLLACFGGFGWYRYNAAAPVAPDGAPTGFNPLALIVVIVLLLLIFGGFGHYRHW